MAKRKTHEEFIQEIFDLVGDEYTILNQYENWKSDLLIRHNKCGREYTIRATNFLSGRRCKKCSDKKVGTPTMTHEEFIKRIYEEEGNKYTVLETYVNASTKIKIRHEECGYEYKVTPKGFKKGNRCPNCKSRKTLESFREDVFRLVENEYKVLERHIGDIGVETKFKIKHTICGYEYLIDSPSFLSGNRCAKCNGNAKKTHEEFLKEVYDLVGDEYTVTGTYVNARIKVDIKHNECGNTHKYKSNQFISRDTRCPYCKFSRGEAKISMWLNEKGIKNQTQYTFSDCIHKSALPFDFAIFDNNSLVMLIEFDGGQHFKPVDWFGGEKGFKKQKIRDEIKNNYCKNNNIKLLRIPYWDIDIIEEILEKEVKIS